jgi:hypothetical protein
MAPSASTWDCARSRWRQAQENTASCNFGTRRAPVEHTRRAPSIAKSSAICSVGHGYDVALLEEPAPRRPEPGAPPARSLTLMTVSNLLRPTRRGFLFLDTGKVAPKRIKGGDCAQSPFAGSSAAEIPAFRGAAGRQWHQASARHPAIWPSFGRHISPGCSRGSPSRSI